MTKPIRTISANDMHVMMSQFLNAANEVHSAMCLFDDDHWAQKHLRNAMHSILIGAEECTKLHGAERISRHEPAGDQTQEIAA